MLKKKAYTSFGGFDELRRTMCAFCKEADMVCMWEVWFLRKRSLSENNRKVNLTSAQHIVNAIKAQPKADNIALVYIGSVAQTGHRNIPYHYGRTGDPD
jgi:nucleoside-diphosphate-sugar epimerase